VEGEQVNRLNRASRGACPEGAPHRGASRGVTLIEIMISIAVLSIFLFAVYTVLFATQRQYEGEMARRFSQMRMQQALDQITADMREGSAGLVNKTTFTDTAFGSNPQGIWCIPSARNITTGNFVTATANPVWQSLIVYAPYWNTASNEGELRRYVVTNAPAQYFTLGAGVNITVNATNIVLDGVTVARNGNSGVAAVQTWNAGWMKVLERVDLFTVTSFSNPVTWTFDIRCKGGLAQTMTTGMDTGAKGRN
jgi:prepilin-type N-terminal cleavage/methylation domain-containing protein